MSETTKTKPLYHYILVNNNGVSGILTKFSREEVTAALFEEFEQIVGRPADEDEKEQLEDYNEICTSVGIAGDFTFAIEFNVVFVDEL